MEHRTACKAADSVGCFLTICHGFDNDEQFIRVRFLYSFEHSHNAFLAVNLEIEEEIGYAVLLEVVLYASTHSLCDFVYL